MIFVECLYCDYQWTVACGPPGAWSKEICDKCKEPQWLSHSRLEPKSYSEDMIEVNEETRRITLKDNK